MKSFKQYITEAERYEFDPPIDLDFENATAWDWTLGPFYNFARTITSIDGPPILPNINFDRYPWTDSNGTWKNPPPGWRVKNPNAPINDRDNWEYIPRPHIRGPNENGRWVWNPAGGGKWVYTTHPVDVVPDTPTLGVPSYQEVPWTQGPKPFISDTSNINESWWWLVPEILDTLYPQEDPGPDEYLPPDQVEPYQGPLTPSQSYPGFYERPMIDPQDPSGIPIRYDPTRHQWGTPAPNPKPPKPPKPPRPPNWPPNEPWPPVPPPDYTKPYVPFNPNLGKPINPSINPGGGQPYSPPPFSPGIDPNILPITR